MIREGEIPTSSRSWESESLTDNSNKIAPSPSDNPAAEYLANVLQGA